MLKPLVTSLLIAHMSPSERLFEEGAILVDLDGKRLSTAKAAVSLAEARDATGYIIIDERIAKLFDEWMLIGRQEDTGFGGRIDLLAIAPDGSLVLIELKRDRTPREVVAQALDYAGWVEKLHAEDIATIYGRFAPGRSLAQDFRERFGQDLDEETLNQNHQIIIVAGSLDDSTERIVSYLSERDIPINVLCFQVFTNGDEQLLTRAWLLAGRENSRHDEERATFAGAEDVAPHIGHLRVGRGFIAPNGLRRDDGALKLRPTRSAFTVGRRFIAPNTAGLWGFASSCWLFWL